MDKEELKELTGNFRRVYRDKTGMFGIETLTLEKGKVVKHVKDEVNYPTVTLNKFGRQGFDEASKAYDASTQVVK